MFFWDALIVCIVVGEKSQDGVMLDRAEQNRAAHQHDTSSTVLADKKDDEV